MELRERRFLITAIFSILSITAAFLYLSITYFQALEEQTQGLTQKVHNRSLYIAQAYEHELEEEIKMGYGPEMALKETLEQFTSVHPSFAKFGKTGEFQLAKIDGSKTHFYLGHDPIDVVSNETLAPEMEPMQKALQKQTGTMVVQDYRGRMVIAAYGPVENLDIGIVAKIDVDEISTPYIKLGALITAIFFVFMVVELLFFTKGHIPN